MELETEQIFSSYKIFISFVLGWSLRFTLDILIS